MLDINGLDSASFDLELVRVSVDVVLNLTAGMGGDLTLGSVEQPLPVVGEDEGEDEETRQRTEAGLRGSLSNDSLYLLAG